MARISEAIITSAYASSSKGSVLDLRHGGQHGWAPNLTEWISNQAYVSKPVVGIVLEWPKMFTAFDNPKMWTDSFRAMMEIHSRSIDGLNQTLTVDTDEHQIGGAGEVQEEVINVTRARSNPKHTIVEKYGRPVQRLLDIWIRYGLMDPETKFALLNKRITNEGSKATDLLADWYTATMLYFQPDPLHRYIDKAWIITNMFPKGTGDITSKRDLTSGQELITLDVEFTGIQQVGSGVDAFAQQILDAMVDKTIDPYTKKAWTTEASQYKGVGYSALREEPGDDYEKSLNKGDPNI